MCVLRLAKIINMTFTYTLDLSEEALGRLFEERDNMNGGLLQLNIPDKLGV